MRPLPAALHALLAASLTLPAHTQNTPLTNFTILTYNIAGLPAFISGKDPTTTIPLISARLSPYPIVHVQEDFNYNALTYASAPHRHKTPSSGPVPLGSGLNTLSTHPYTDLTRVPWDACWFAAGDCLTPKGFSAMRITLAPGAVVDFYNLHAEAGDTDRDFTARTEGFRQLLEFVNVFSKGNAVVLAGDTNTRYTQARDPVRLLAAAGLRDVWVELVRGTPPAPGESQECRFPVAAGAEELACELVDKVFFRSSAALRLRPRAYRNENARFVRADGGPLSDHFPLAVEFEVSQGERVWGSESVGGVGGGYWTDLQAWREGRWVQEVGLRGGSRVDALEVRFSDGGSVRRGGEGGVERGRVDVRGGVREVEVCEGQMNGGWGVHYMRVVNKAGERVEAGRVQAGMRCRTFAGEGDGIVGFWGRSGREIDQLAILWGKK